MKRKIKLTDKDLEIKITSSDSCNLQLGKEYPTLNKCQTQTTCYKCPPVQTGDACFGSKNCIEPVTKDTQCVETGACPETFRCDNTYDCISDNCQESNDCPETKICVYETVTCAEPNTDINICGSNNIGCIGTR